MKRDLLIFKPISAVMSAMQSELWVMTALKYIEEKDLELYQHSINVALLSAMIIIYTGQDDMPGMSNVNLRDVLVGALVHDVGKVATTIVKGKHFDEMSIFEQQMFLNHITSGSAYIRSATSNQTVIEIVEKHHEYLDGTGKPSQLKGEDIPVYVRVVTIANVLDNFLSETSYEGNTEPEIMIKLREYFGGKKAKNRYDLTITRDFLDSIGGYVQMVLPLLEQFFATPEKKSKSFGDTLNIE